MTLVVVIASLLIAVRSQGPPQQWFNPCTSSSVSLLPFCNMSLSFAERSYDLVYNQIPKLSDSNDIYAGLTGTTEWLGIPSLKISRYVWQNEALHGVADSPGVNWKFGPVHYATMFPQIITTSSSFNSTLFHNIGFHISNEARTMFNYRQAGLTFWAPNINIFRDPRWGRGGETPGEDPFLSGIYAMNYVGGMQGNDDRYLKVSASCKHFADYSMEDSDGVNRHNFNAIVNEYDQNDTYLVAFKYCVVSGNASSIMCSYNSLNGTPSCANPDLLTNTIRNEWNFNGYVVSDCDAVDDVQHSHNYTKTTGETINAVFSAGMDIDCGYGFESPSYTQANTANAIQQNDVKLSDVQRAVYNTILVQMRLGMYDNESLIPWSEFNKTKMCTNESLQISLDAARQGMVLIKNNDNALPISIEKENISNVALIGPNAQNKDVMKGSYAGTPPFVIDVYDGLSQYISPNDVLYFQGCDVVSNDTSGISDAVHAAEKADLTILVMGLDNSCEGEANDRINLQLPGEQHNLIKRVSENAKGKVILVMLNGGCVDIEIEYDSKYINAIIVGGYPGMFGGEAINDVIFGKFNPTGRLTQTWYLNDYINEIEMINMDMRPNETTNSPGRGYRYYGGENILFNFGDGLSYTIFNCTELVIGHNNDQLTTTITNTGNISGGAVVLVFFVPFNGGENGVELKRLVAFQRVNMLHPSQSKTVTMAIYSEFYNSNEHKNMNGSYNLAGSCSN
eukprot:486024_1